MELTQRRAAWHLGWLGRVFVAGTAISAGVVFANESARAGAAPAPGDPVCGFIAGPHFYYEVAQVRAGLAVTLTPCAAQAGQPVTLRFVAQERPRDFPVDRLQIEHEKFMHIIGVRDDLAEFFHVHPVRVGAGMWEVTHTFSHGGTYKLWCDVKYRGTSYSFGQAPLTVVGSFGPEGTERTPQTCACVAGYRVALQCPQPLVAEATNQLQFLIQDSAGNPAELENFLGAPMHLVIVRKGLSVYLHAHPESRRPGDAVVRFKQTFPKPGAYTLFAQFRPKQARLALDDALLAELRVDVPGK